MLFKMLAVLFVYSAIGLKITYIDNIFPGEYPFLIAMHNLTDPGMHVCSGSAMTEWFLVTSYLCALNIHRGSVDIIAGDVAIEPKCQMIQKLEALRYAKHPYLDVCVVQLKTRLIWNEAVQSLTDKGYMKNLKRTLNDLKNSQCFIVGHENSNTGCREKTRVTKTLVEVFDDNRCDNAVYYIPEHQVCLTGYYYPRCVNYEGSPLICNDTWAGIVTPGAWCQCESALFTSTIISDISGFALETMNMFTNDEVGIKLMNQYKEN